MIPPFRRLLAALFLLPLAAQGTIVTIATDEDDGSLVGGSGISLREAVKYSPGTITFAPALSGQTIRLTLGEILISQSLTIDGSALPEKITLSGDKTGDGKTADDTRVFNITTGTVLLDSLVITGGYCPAGSAATQGAGIFVNSITTLLTLRNSTLTSNHADSGAAIYFSGLLNSPESSLLIQNSIFSSNTATNGGALYGREASAKIEQTLFTGNSATSYGGAIWNRLNLDLTTSTLSGNSASYGGGIFHFSNKINVERTTISNNSATLIGGGLYFTLGGNSLTVNNSTVAGNSALRAYGGGIYSEAQSGQMSLLHTTVSNNSATTTGGIFSFNSFSLNNSIVAGNIGQTPADISRSFSGSRNIASSAISPPVNPLLVRLAPLGDYGCPTLTMPPLPGSPAIDAGGTSALTTDQRGLSRDPQPDIGAVEYQGPSDLTRFWRLDFDGDNSPYGTEQALGTDPLVSDPANSRNITAPVLNASGHPVLSFGIGAAAPGTSWVLCRSTDLLLFTEIYRYDGSTDTAVPGVTFLRTATGVTVTDTTPPPGGVFYRFEAVLGPQ
ncbi:MAG: choice-of-anchor Q domain-containing protein [Luteolibacter sp.]